MSVHPTVAVAPSEDPERLVNAWFDYDGHGAATRARAAAHRACEQFRSVAFLAHRHAQGAHLLVPVAVPWEAYVRFGRRTGADMRAADFAVHRGMSFLRGSARPYDDVEPRIVMYAPRPHGSAMVMPIDLRQAAGLGAYLSLLAPSQVATYPQMRGESRGK